MEQWQIKLIQAALNRCYGLAEGIRKENDLQELYIKSLAGQAGLRIDFIFKHIEEIKQLSK